MQCCPHWVDPKACYATGPRPKTLHTLFGIPTAHVSTVGHSDSGAARGAQVESLEAHKGGRNDQMGLLQLFFQHQFLLA